jgi:hypothetical protein
LALPCADISFDHVDAFGDLLGDQVFHAHLSKPKISQVTKTKSSLLLQIQIIYYCFKQSTEQHLLPPTHPPIH